MHNKSEGAKNRSAAGRQQESMDHLFLIPDSYSGSGKHFSQMRAIFSHCNRLRGP